MKEAMSRNRRQVGEVWKAREDREGGRGTMREDLRSYCGRGEAEDGLLTEGDAHIHDTGGR